MRGILKIATRLFLLTAAVGAAACGGDSSGSTGPSDPGPSKPGPSAPSNPAGISGSYALKGVRTLGHLGGGGNGLPVTFIDGSGDHLTFVSGTLILGADKSFDLKVQVTFNGSSSELTDYGTYSASGSAVTFHSQKSTPRLSTGAMSGSMIIAKSQVGGIPFEFDVQK